MKRILVLLTACSLVLLAACNTVYGVGKDIQKAGDSISGASKQ